MLPLTSGANDAEESAGGEVNLTSTDLELTNDDATGAGNQIVGLVRISGVSKGADLPFEHLWAYVCRVEDGQLVHQRAYWEPAEALSDTGVESSP